MGQGRARHVIGIRGLATSLVVHLLLAGILFLLPARFVKKSGEPLRVDFVFYPEPDPAPEPVADPLPPPPAPEPEGIEPPPDPPPVATHPPPVIAQKEPPPLPPPLPPRQTGHDPAPAPTVSAPKPPTPQPRPVIRTNVLDGVRENTGLETPPQRKVARAGSFDALSASRSPSAGSRSTPGNGVVLDAGFNAESPRKAATGSSRTVVREGGFGDAVVTVEPREVRPALAVTLDVPLEIVSKPKPVYPERARRLRVEGEVLLEVVFGASGRLRVTRVLKGLGHGLDASAVEAARRIDFKPARRDGKPIDYVATLRIVFQLV